VLGEGRVARTPWFAVAKDAVEQDFYLPRPTHTDRVGILYADDFNLSTTIARITVVQNLSHVQHNAPSSPAHTRPNTISPIMAQLVAGLKSKCDADRVSDESDVRESSSCQPGQRGNGACACAAVLTLRDRGQGVAPLVSAVRAVRQLS
jgi:hypothetical protein